MHVAFLNIELEDEVKAPKSNPVKRKKKSAYEIWEEQENDRIFRSAIKGYEDRIAAVEKVIPGFLKEVRKRLIRN